MSLTIEQITEEAMHLSAESRAELAEKLVLSLDSEEEGELRSQWVDEALRRRDEVRSGAVKTIPGDKVLAEMRRRAGR